MNVTDYINYESERQSATAAERDGMLGALMWLTAAQLDSINEDNIITLAHYINGTTYWRQVPAYFAGGGHAINWTQIPRAMAALVSGIQNDLGNDGDVHEDEADFWTKEFLIIHPFADGNGRVASLLRNWMLGTLDDPETMPYYFGGS